MLCAPALTTETLQSTIAELKEKMDSKYVLPYTREKLATDLEAGSVDSAALKQMFGFNENVMKVGQAPVANLVAVRRCHRPPCV